MSTNRGNEPTKGLSWLDLFGYKSIKLVVRINWIKAKERRTQVCLVEGRLKGSTACMTHSNSSAKHFIERGDTVNTPWSFHAFLSVVIPSLLAVENSINCYFVVLWKDWCMKKNVLIAENAINVYGRVYICSEWRFVCITYPIEQSKVWDFFICRRSVVRSRTVVQKTIK